MLNEAEEEEYVEDGESKRPRGRLGVEYEGMSAGERPRHSLSLRRACFFTASSLSAS